MEIDTISKFDPDKHDTFIHKHLILPSASLDTHVPGNARPAFNEFSLNNESLFDTYIARSPKNGEKEVDYLSLREIDPELVAHFFVYFFNKKTNVVASFNFSLQPKNAPKSVIMNGSRLYENAGIYAGSFFKQNELTEKILDWQVGAGVDTPMVYILNSIWHEYGNKKKYTDEIRKSIGYEAIENIFDHFDEPNRDTLFDAIVDSDWYMHVIPVRPMFNPTKVLGYDCGYKNPDKEIMIQMDENCYLQNNQNRNYDAELYNVYEEDDHSTRAAFMFLTDDTVRNITENGGLITDGNGEFYGKIVNHFTFGTHPYISRFWLPHTHRFVYDY